MSSGTELNCAGPIYTFSRPFAKLSKQFFFLASDVPSPLHVMKWTGKSVTRLTLHKRRALSFQGISIEHIPFLIAYLFTVYHCAVTIGEPYNNRINQLKEEGKIPYEVETEEEIASALAV